MSILTRLQYILDVSNDCGSTRDEVSMKIKQMICMMPWVVNMSALGFITVSHQAPINYLEFEIFGVCVDVYKSPGANDLKESQARPRQVQHLVGDYMPSTECGALLPRSAAEYQMSPDKN